MTVLTKQERRQQALLKCKHFNGTIHDECNAGVNYEAVKDAGRSPYRWACLHDGADIHCPFREYPTNKELDDGDAQVSAIIENVFTVRKVIIGQTKGKRNTQGRVDCPVCKVGSVSYSVAGNGHVHATCSTSGCVSWME